LFFLAALLVGRALVSWTVVLKVSGAVVGWGATLSVAWPIVLEPRTAVLEVAAHAHCEGVRVVVGRGLVWGLVLLLGWIV
jgi:hypothetical protein